MNPNGRNQHSINEIHLQQAQNTLGQHNHNKPFTQILRQAVHPQHQALEALPFNRALLNKCLPLAAYQGQLAAYYSVLRTLEDACAALAAPLDGVWHENLRRSGHIEADLCFWQCWPLPQPELAETRAFVEQLQEFQQHLPAALLGCLYVFEGSMLGSQLLLPCIQQTYALHDGGCHYYAAWQEYAPNHWQQFKQRLDACASDTLQCDDAHAAAILVGARCAFTHVQHLLTALLPE